MKQLSEENIKKPESSKRSQIDLLDLKAKFAKLLESQKLPFTITKEIVRYLDDILYLYNECSPDSNVLYLIKEEIDDETDREERWDRYFWRYLEEQNIAVLLPYIEMGEVKKITDNILTPKLIAIGRPHKREKPIEKFFARPEHWKEDLEKVARLTRENEQDEKYIPYLVVRVFEIELVKELFYFFKSKSLEEHIEGEKVQKVDIDLADLIKVSQALGSSKLEQKGKSIKNIELPEDTKWQNITIRFIDNDDNVEISVKGRTICTASFVEMGFENTKNNRPNYQWGMLQTLALQKGEISWGNVLNTPIKDRNKYKKRIQKLSDTLKEYFQMSEYPFYPYKKEGSYKIKFNLMRSYSDLSESETARRYEDESGVSRETKEYIDEIAPSVYEEEKEHDDNY